MMGDGGWLCGFDAAHHQRVVGVPHHACQLGLHDPLEDIVVLLRLGDHGCCEWRFAAA